MRHAFLLAVLAMVSAGCTTTTSQGPTNDDLPVDLGLMAPHVANIQVQRTTPLVPGARVQGTAYMVNLSGPYTGRFVVANVDVVGTGIAARVNDERLVKAVEPVSDEEALSAFAGTNCTPSVIRRRSGSPTYYVVAEGCEMMCLSYRYTVDEVLIWGVNCTRDENLDDFDTRVIDGLRSIQAKG